MSYPDWFNGARIGEIFNKNLSNLAGTPIRVLQIGAYTGDATEWLLDNILTHPDSKLIDVDTWGGSDEPEHKSFNWKEIENLYLERHKEAIESKKLTVNKMTSDHFFHQLDENEKFDFIYIDGDHKASTVLRDAVNAYNHIKIYGIIAFDDYAWTLNKGKIYDPKTAIDAFYSCNSDSLKIIDVNWQFWVKRL